MLIEEHVEKAIEAETKGKRHHKYMVQIVKLLDGVKLPDQRLSLLMSLNEHTHGLNEAKAELAYHISVINLIETYNQEFSG